MPYENRHRLFIQYMLSTPAVAEQVALDVYAKVLTKFVDDPEPPQLTDLRTFINEINREIASIDFQLRIQVCEMTAVRYLTLINTASSAINGMLPNYAPNELEFFKKVIDEIVGTDDGQVSHITCLNIEDMKSLRKADMEKLLFRFVNEKWLAIFEAGKYRLGIRSLSELRPHFTATYKDFLMKCVLCSEMIFYGRRCQQCGSIGHLHCLLEYVRANKGKTSMKCPGKNCTEPIDNVESLIEVASLEDESSTSGPTRKKKLRTMED